MYFKKFSTFLLGVLFVVLASPLAAKADYTMMQWGMDKTTVPYNFGANINGTWRNFGTVSSVGVWNIPSSNLSFTQSGTGAVARTIDSKLKDIVSVMDFGAKGDGVTDDAAAFNAASTYVASIGTGGTVYIPKTSSFYKLNSTFIVPQNASVRCEDGAMIKPGASMTDLVKITSSGGARLTGNCYWVNQSSYATNGIALDPAVPGNNNDNHIADASLYTFTNNILNRAGGGWEISDIWSQNATAWDIRSTDNGTNAMIRDIQSLGSNGGIYFSKTTSQIEGVQITNVSLLPTGGTCIKFSGGLNNRLTDSMCDQLGGNGIELDGDSGYPVADTIINNVYFGPNVSSVGSLYGVYMHGNVADTKIDGITTAGGFTQCGIMMKSSASGNVTTTHVFNSRFTGNAVDVCSDGTVGAVASNDFIGNNLLSTVNVTETGTVRNSWFNNNIYGSSSFSTTTQRYYNRGVDLDASTNKWAPWTTYTPTLSCVSGSLGSGNTATGRWIRERNTVHVEVTITMGASGAGTCGSLFQVSLPVQVNSTFSSYGNGISSYANGSLTVAAFNNTTNAGIYNYTGDANGVISNLNSSTFRIAVTYEATP